jgi:hypothetical protein
MNAGARAFCVHIATSQSFMCIEREPTEIIRESWVGEINSHQNQWISSCCIGENMGMWTVGTLCREKLSPPASTTRSLGTSVVSTLHDAYNPGGTHYQCPQETPVPDKAAQTNSKLKTLQIEVLAWDSACTLCITRSSKKQRDHWTLFLFSPKLLPSRNIYIIIIIIIISPSPSIFLSLFRRLNFFTE